ncbi:DinB family protein [Cohnella suwonensis]|uniref:DinB family protein n=1 Tax=Cohnella suwonensis TaxID=696072 RepID=A0ABW0LNZ0_9BACL
MLERLDRYIAEVPPLVRAIPEASFSERRRPDKWSGKEILGHLCDSALTNTQRYVRAQYEPLPYRVLKCAQDDWVALMRYRDAPAAEVLALWEALNRQISRILANVPDERWLTPCDNGGEHPVTLAWLAEDYVAHMEHHLGQIFGER